MGLAPPGYDIRMPKAVRFLIVMLFVTALSAAAAEVLNWWFTRDADYGLFVRTTWALLRSLAFLVVIWQVYRGRAVAAPFTLILSITTLFALGRLLIPKHGMPTTLGVATFAWVALCCTAVLVLLYRSATVREHLTRHPSRLVFDRRGVQWRAAPPRRPPTPGWALTARVAALSYSPLVIVAAAVAMGRVFAGRLDLITIVFPWLAGGLALGYVVNVLTIFLVRGKRWSANLLLWLTVVVVVLDLFLCWLVLGVDGLVRDGGPLAVAGLLVLLGIARSPAQAGLTPRRRWRRFPSR
jgi:hypothetical protein